MRDWEKSWEVLVTVIKFPGLDTKCHHHQYKSLRYHLNQLDKNVGYYDFINLL
jgi:hypothetical protein